MDDMRQIIDFSNSEALLRKLEDAPDDPGKRLNATLNLMVEEGLYDVSLLKEYLQEVEY